MSRVEHWDRDRYVYERDHGPSGTDRRGRYEEHDHHFRGPAGSRIRDHSDERYDRRPRGYDDDQIRDRQQYDDDVRYYERRDRVPYPEHEIIHEDERRRSAVREVSPPSRRPEFLRRQSSLDTFDRRPLHYYGREEYGPPTRKEQYRPEPYVPIPLPRTRQLGPPPTRRANDRYPEEVRISETDVYGDAFRSYHERPERVFEKEVVRSRRRGRSRDSSLTSRTYTRTSRSSSSSSRSSSRSRATTVRSQYPKKGKTKIPARLVSKRALIDLGYPFVEEGNSIIVLKALGQDNIDEVLRVSEEYKKSEYEISAARSSAGNIAEERHEEVYVAPRAPSRPPTGIAPPSTRPPTTIAAPVPAPVYVNAAPPPAPAELEVVKRETVVRDVSPSRHTTITGTTSEYPEAPLVIRERSRSRHSRREIRAEIRALEAELHTRKHHRGDELVRAERLPDGGLIIQEERVERVDEGHRGPRIEKDRKGRMSISVPKHR